MEFPIYETRDLLGVMYDDVIDAPSNFFLDNFFPGTHQSPTQKIVFEKIIGRRALAPFVRPQNTGKPIWSRKGSAIESFEPAYIKPKDVVRPVEMIERQPGQMFSTTPNTPQQNYDQEVVRIAQFHRDSIERTWEVMAAQAVIYGVTAVDYLDGSTVEVDFHRDANLTVLKNANYWTDTYDILSDIQLWADRMSVANFGGIPNMLLVSPDVWAVMRTNTKLIAQMSTQTKGVEVLLKQGLVLPDNRKSRIRYVGTVGAGIDVWVFNDYYVNDAGVQVPYLPAKNILLIDTNFEGVKAFGAILDKAANLAPLPIFPKMWDQEDPSATVIMSQSAPLMIPVHPNRSLRAKVLA